MRFGAQYWMAFVAACGCWWAGASAQSAPAAEGKAVGWVAPYLTDDFSMVVLVDVEKLGPFWPTAQALLKLEGGEKLPDFADLEFGALLVGRTADPEVPPKAAVLLRTKTPLTAQRQQQFTAMLRGLMNLPENDEEFEQQFSQFDPALARQIAPKMVVDGNTVILGLAGTVDALHAKTGAGAGMVKALGALGEHAFRVNVEINENDRAQINAAIGGVEERGPINAGPSEAAMLKYFEMMGKSQSVGVSVDVSPRLGCMFRFVPNAPEDAALIRKHAQSLLDSLKAFVRVMQSTVEVDPATAEEKAAEPPVFAKFFEDVAQRGRVMDRDGVVQFEWQSSPELANQLPGAVADMIAARRRVAATMQRASKLKNLANGLLLFADRYNERLPCNIISADGKPLMSWRVALLPVMEYEHIYEKLRLNEPWDSAHNAALLKQVDPRLFASNAKTPDGHADMLAVIGKGFGFSPTESRNGRGVVSIGSVTDGMSYTAFLVEVEPAMSVPWAKPEDYKFNPDQPTKGLGAPEDKFFQAVFGDTRVQRVSKDESVETLRRLFNRSDGKAYELKTLPD